MSHQLWRLFKFQNVKADAQIKVTEGIFSFVFVFGIQGKLNPPMFVRAFRRIWYQGSSHGIGIFNLRGKFYDLTTLVKDMFTCNEILPETVGQ